MTVDATLLAWLRSRLPATAGAAVSPIPAPGLAADGLLGEEAALVARAGPARQADFRAGRIAARQALSSIGIAPAAILAHPAGDPIWPDGMVGSISHGGGWAAAVVARRNDFRGLGLDLEGADPLEPGIVDLICRPEERFADPGLTVRGIDAAKLRFVAKEAWYKAVFPQWRRFIGFEDATVAIDSARNMFHARFVGHAPGDDSPPAAGGDFLQAQGLLFAVCFLPAPARV